MKKRKGVGRTNLIDILSVRLFQILNGFNIGSRFRLFDLKKRKGVCQTNLIDILSIRLFQNLNGFNIRSTFSNLERIQHPFEISIVRPEKKEGGRSNKSDRHPIRSTFSKLERIQHPFNFFKSRTDTTSVRDFDCST